MSSMALDGLTPRSRSTDPVTSQDAGREVNLYRSQEVVYELMLRSERDWTQGELEFQFTYTPQRVRSAVSELREKGLVELTGEQRITRHGRKADVYRAVRRE